MTFEPTATAAAGALVEPVLSRLRTLRERVNSVEPLEGGLTNHNYKVRSGGVTYVVRVSDPVVSGLSIDRDVEHANSRIAAAVGVGAEVLEWSPEANAMVFAYIEGRTLTSADLQLPENIERVAAACRRLHAAERFVNDFDMFVLQRRYRAIVRDRGITLPTGYDSHAEAFSIVERALAALAPRTVPCNNDLLAANLIDDGASIRIIDYEYSGNNDPAFELGNLWSECQLDEDHLAMLVRAYYGKVSRSQVARARLHAVAAQYGWTLWAVIQHATSGIDFDYWTWGMEKYDAACSVFTGSGFHRLIKEVAQDD